MEVLPDVGTGLVGLPEGFQTDDVNVLPDVETGLAGLPERDLEGFQTHDVGVLSDGDTGFVGRPEWDLEVFQTHDLEVLSDNDTVLMDFLNETWMRPWSVPTCTPDLYRHWIMELKWFDMR